MSKDENKVWNNVRNNRENQPDNIERSNLRNKPENNAKNNPENNAKNNLENNESLEVRRKINQLVQASRDGDLGASEELLTRLQPLMVATIKRNFKYYGPNWEDLMQEASLSVLVGIRDYDEQRGIPFLAYIKTKLKFDIHNLCRKESNYGSRLVTTDEEGLDPLDTISDDTANPQEEFLQKEMTIELQEALEQLDPHHRELIYLAFYSKLTLKDAAKKMGICYKTAQRYKAKALERLAGLLRSIPD